MREILTRTGEVKELMRIFSVSKPTVINALKYRVNTQLACRIRKTAIERGGVELRHKLIVLYFTLSFCITCGVVEAELWQLAVVVANFALSAWLVKRVPLPEDEKEGAA